MVVRRFLTFSKRENKKNLKKRKEALDPFRSARKHTHAHFYHPSIFIYRVCMYVCVREKRKSFDGEEGRIYTVLALACTGAAVVGGAVGRRAGWRKTFISWHRLETTRRARSCFPFALSLHPQLTRI